MNSQPVSVEAVAQAAALVRVAVGADTAAIDALEAVLADLRRARAAREQLVGLPAEALRQALVARTGTRR